MCVFLASIPVCLLPPPFPCSISVLGVDSGRKGSNEYKIQRIWSRSSGAEQLALHLRLDSTFSKIYTLIRESESESASVHSKCELNTFIMFKACCIHELGWGRRWPSTALLPLNVRISYSLFPRNAVFSVYNKNCYLRKFKYQCEEGTIYAA